mmetsp:Transcript_6178/g.15139  ORF Transcript_6178/g.15139 Transcript_6178/m.15139 type:complete len:407 (+) Transcript_6178:1235-2455(+)
MPLVLAPLVVFDQQVVVQVVATPEHRNLVFWRHFHHDETHNLLIKLCHESVQVLLLHHVIPFGPQIVVMEIAIQKVDHVVLYFLHKVVNERRDCRQVISRQVADVRGAQERRPVDQVENMAEGVLRLWRYDRECIQQRRVGGRVWLRDDAIVLLGVQGEGREQEVQSLCLVGLVEAAHVDTEHILGVLRHVCEPRRRVRVAHEEALLGLRHLLEGRLEAVLRQDRDWARDVHICPPMEYHGHLDQEVKREWPLLLGGECPQIEHRLHNRVIVILVPFLLLLRHGAVGAVTALGGLALALLQRGLLGVLEDLLNLFPLSQGLVSDGPSSRNVQAHEGLHAFQNLLWLNQRVDLMSVLQEVHLPEHGHHAILEVLHSLAQLFRELLQLQLAQQVHRCKPAVLLAWHRL